MTRAELFNKNKYCPLCDHAISKEKIERIKFDVECPKCKQANISRFYSFGSQYHRERWEDYKFGESRSLYNVRLLPVAFPYETKELFND